MTDASRPTTAIDAIAEDWVRSYADLVPEVAVWIGIEGRTGDVADLSPAGHEALVEAQRQVVERLSAAQPADDVDRVTQTDLLNELHLAIESHEAQLHLRDLNVIASPSQELRETFDLMPHATASDWSTIAERLSNVPKGLSGYIETLRQGIAEGVVPARRQVVEVAAQARKHADPLGFFFDFTGGAELEGGGAIPDSLAAQLRTGAEASAGAYDAFAEFLETELAPEALDEDAVGRDAYALHSRHFLGAAIDLDETYEWGIDELRRMVDEQTRIAGEIKSGASVHEAIEFLDKDDSRKLHGTDELKAWMQALSDKAVNELAANHFEIPEPVRNLECMIAPTQEGGIYYTSPSDDFSRPGRMWWSVPEGVTEFDTWRETTTVYHEGVPGHHLQLGQAVYNRALLNTWRRSLAGTSGHAEGWALYAERLMGELGYLDDPAYELGMLRAQAMRAVRVVVDIGMHLELTIPAHERYHPGERWTPELALPFVIERSKFPADFMASEVDRYLGLPGQAISYKVGERVWLGARDAARARAGASFDVKEFHRAALDLGPMGLAQLDRELARL